MSNDLPWGPQGEVIGSGETRISACCAMPFVNGKGLKYVSWYRIDPEKVTICFSDGNGHKRTREFNIRDVELSGWPADQLFARKDSPREDSPV